MCVLELLDCFILYLSPFLSFSLRLFFPPRSFLPAFQSTFLSVQTHGGGGGDECRFVTLSIVVNYLVWYVFFKFKENIVNRITRCNRDKVLLTMIQVTYVYTYICMYTSIFLNERILIDLNSSLRTSLQFLFYRSKKILISEILSFFFKIKIVTYFLPLLFLIFHTS